MTTYKLTPKAANAIGLSNEMLGWHFIGSEVANVLEGCDTVFLQGQWKPHLQIDESIVQTPPLWQLELSKLDYASIFVEDTQWFCFDGTYITVFDEDYVTENFNVAPM